MGASFGELRDDHVEFIAAQTMFFVASAPGDAGGHVNLSPKGGDTFRVIDRSSVAYLDLTGSGAETIAHVRNNGRITVMFCSFGAKPLILRIFGHGRVVPIDAPEAAEFADVFPSTPGERAVIAIAVDEVRTSCGYGVPVMELVEERPRLLEWAEGKGPGGIAAYQADRNQRSLDDLPAMEGL